MKKIYFFSAVLIALLVPLSRLAAETEPNNTPAQANVLAVNGSGVGSLSGSDVDWWKVTTGSDGLLSVGITPTNGKYIWGQIFDADGTTVFQSLNGNAKFTLEVDGLAAGVYYIRLYMYYSTESSGYSISNVLTVPTQLNDIEPNNSRAAALRLPLNSAKTGHIGYYNNNRLDSSDWYKVTTNADGRLKVKLQVANGQYVWVHLYDFDGATVLASGNTNSTLNISADGLAVGTYYIRIVAYYANGFAPYTIGDSLQKAVYVNDPEPNATPATARTISVNSFAVGHIGFYYNHKLDTIDWYKFTTPDDGSILVKLTPANGQYLWCALYDGDHETLLKRVNANSEMRIDFDGLAKGTYYVAVYAYYRDGFSPYKIVDSLRPCSRASDPEYNDKYAVATVLGLDSTVEGRIGYYYNHYSDSSDWYVLTVPDDGKIMLKLSPANGQYVWCTLFDLDGTTILARDNGASEFKIQADGLAKGTYYVLVRAYYSDGFAPYLLTDSLYVPDIAADVEPNNTANTADSLGLNSQVSGRVGYYYNHVRDVNDWYWFNTNQDGEIYLKLYPQNGQILWVELLGSDGATVYARKNSSSTAVLSVDGLVAGKYFVHVSTYYTGDGFAPYILKDSLVPAVPANDIEPNNSRLSATSLPLNTRRFGHIGYTRVGYRDNEDWYKVLLTQDGRLRLTLTPANGQYVYMTLFDNDGTTLLATGYGHDAFDISRSDLAAGKYYVKVHTYYNDGFAPYTIADSFFRALPANDIEPNNSTAQAITLTANSSRTGHAGFYYMNKRDTADWYVLSIGAQKKLKLTLVPYYGSYMWIHLFDASGNLVASQYGSSTFDLIRNAINPGTYFIRITQYYQNQFSTYMLTDSLFAPNSFNEPLIASEAQKSIPDQINSGTPALRVYPVPAQQNLFVEGFKNSGVTSMQVFDEKGRMMLNVPGNKLSSTIHRLDVSNLPNGVYTIRLVNADRSFTVKKFMIMR